MKRIFLIALACGLTIAALVLGMGDNHLGTIMCMVLAVVVAAGIPERRLP